MTRIVKTLFVLLTSLLMFGGVAHAAVPLVDADPIAVPAGANQKAVAVAIRQALIGRGWVASSEKPGEIDATINVRNKHTAQIAIDYDTRKVGIKYVSSTNLDYTVKDGVPMIHRNYPRWINLLLTDISRNLVTATSH